MFLLYTEAYYRYIIRLTVVFCLPHTLLFTNMYRVVLVLLPLQVVLVLALPQSMVVESMRLWIHAVVE